MAYVQNGIECGAGLGCAGLGCVPCGMGGLTMDGTGLFGSGLFSGDVSTWGVPEIVAGGLGFLALLSLFSSTKRTAKRIRAGARGAYRGGLREAKAAA